MITVATARNLAKKHDCQIIVIFDIEPGGAKYRITTYGRNRELCAWAAKVGDNIHEAVMQGHIVGLEHAENPYETIQHLNDEITLLRGDNEHLGNLLAEVLRHDENNYGTFTAGMKQRIHAAIDELEQG